MRPLPLLVLFLEGAASAGPLGKVVEGMHEAAARDERKDDRGGGGARSDDVPYRSDDRAGYEVSGPVYVNGVVVEGGGGPPTPVSLDASVAVARITDSGPAFSAALGMRFGPVAVAGQLTSFFEEDGEETTRLDLWKVGGGLRLMSSDDTALWLDLAIAGVQTEPELSLVGFSLAGRLEQHLTRAIGVSASVGSLVLEHDIKALDVVVAARLYCLTIGYRLLDFNVGPPLHGPEMGLAFSI